MSVVTLEALRRKLASGERLPKIIPLDVFHFAGVCLHQKKAWPKVGNAFVGYLPADKGMTFHTTQKYVSGEVVERKIREIVAGKKRSVSVVLRDDDATWIFNGHHTLAAYLILGRAPLVALHDPQRGRSLEAPKFINERGQEIGVSGKRTSGTLTPAASRA